MSQSTPAAQDPVVRPQKKRGVVCNVPNGRQRCLKRVLNTEGEIACGNKHAIPLDDLLDGYFLNQDSDPFRVLYGFMPGPEAMRSILRRITSPEFTQADPYGSDSWKRIWMSFSPGRFGELLRYADTCDRQSAAMLREIWLQNLEKTDNLVWRYLLSLDPGPRRLAMERCLFVWGRNGYRDPLQHLFWSPIRIEAAKALNDPLLPFYEYSLYQAGLVAQGLTSTPAIFNWRLAQNENLGSWPFHILLDPDWEYLPGHLQFGVFFDREHLGGHFTFGTGQLDPYFRRVYQVLEEEERRVDDSTRRRDAGPELRGSLSVDSDHVNIVWEHVPHGTSKIAKCLYAVEKVRSVISLRRNKILGI